MCGIVGWVGPIDADPEALARMQGAVRHRGPDDAGAHVEPGRVGIGFRRLSIIDVQHGGQPHRNEVGSVVAACNGEIYNFRQLRSDLRRRGHTICSGSDCEVLPHLYEEHGDDMLAKLRGMFALVVWDSKAQKLILARDRLGVKPLYWARHGEGLVFGSEPGAILAGEFFPPVPDEMAIGQYLTLQYVPAPRSGFANIQKLGPGERLVFSDGKVTIDRYWRLDEDGPKLVGISDRDLLDQVEEAVREATQIRLVSDVPLGAFLSGGVDSSLVVSYAAEVLPQLKTFSIDFRHEDFSEGAHARRVAALYGTDHTEYVVDAQSLPTILAAAERCGEPFADVSAIPTYVLSQVTRSQVTVALSGDGGDEAFGGYRRYVFAAHADRVDPLLRVAGRLTGRTVHRAVAGRGRILQRLGAFGRGPHDRYAALMVHFAPERVADLTQPDRETIRAGSRDAWFTVLALPKLPSPDRYRALDTVTYLPGDLLTKVDRMSMAHALEVRSPLLDHRVHELAARLPARMKIRGGRTKWALKQLAARQGLPDDLVHRRKQGFGVPIGEWLRTDLRDWLEELLRDRSTVERGYFRQPVVEQMLTEHLDGRAAHDTRLWNLAMLELWHRAWIDRPAQLRSYGRDTAGS